MLVRSCCFAYKTYCFLDVIVAVLLIAFNVKAIPNLSIPVVFRGDGKMSLFCG